MDEESPPEEGEENVYKEGTREELVENDELSPQEEAFMKGYDEESTKDESDDASDDDEHSEEKGS